jgi:hypothetical protein
MVARIKFDEAGGTVAADSIASGLKGTFDGSLITWCTGRNDSGVSFNGGGYTTNRVLFQDARLRFQDNFTLACWAKPSGATPYTNNSNDHTRLLFPAGSGHYTWGDDNVCGVGIVLGTNSVSVYERSNSALTTVIKLDTAFSGWTHITVAYSARQPRLYLNGTLVGTGTMTGNTAVRPSLTIGGDYQDWYVGSVDEVTLFTRALSDAEVRALADGTFSSVNAAAPAAAGRPLLSLSPNPFNPSAWIRFSTGAMDRGGSVRLAVYDLAGRLVRDLTPSKVAPGAVYSVEWNGTDKSGRRTASGVYVARLVYGRKTLNLKLVMTN